jgi:hypothetical protein
MRLRLYVTFMLAGTVLCWTAWLLTVFFLDPTATGWLGFSLFYSSLGLSLVGSFSLLGMGLRLWLIPDDVVFRQVAIAFRQSFSFSFLVLSALFLQSQGIFTWWSMLLLLAALTLLEFTVLALKRREPPL